ncbi:fimbrial major subunit CsuA/B family protein [Xylophilus rhododendri]|uniref:Fimbrial major subunit CsuA/B family protein n=1 Tax=Xylophilus rhododendri TaxID=2697032 RepID=A0A857IYX3_9BURK|nr:spore coat protein U domain-containing protein [Xylophilus rhododendri]QHI96784.1 fimbrial major subunit CsuA/B family protein [Xylophilus rhododendri]
MFKTLALGGIAAALALAGFTADAATTANVNVSLSVTAGCQLFVGAASATAGSADLDLGALVNYGAGVVDRSVVDGSTGSGTAGTANVIGVSCGDNGATALTPVLTVTSGTNDLQGARRLASGTSFIGYTLHSDASTDAGSLLANGDAVPLTGTAGGVGGGSSAAALFARVTDPTAVPAAGTYTDTILLTLTF